MMENCPICQAPRKTDSKFCDQCGHKFQDNRCPECNEVVDAQAVFCDHCGCKLKEKSSVAVFKEPAESPSTSIPEAVENITPVQIPQGSIVGTSDKYQESKPIEISGTNNQYQSQYQNQYQQSKPKKSKGVLVALIVIVVIIAAAGAIYMVFRGRTDKPASTDIPPEIAEQTNTAEVAAEVEKESAVPKYSYEVVDVIRPALYQSTDYLVLFRGSCEEDSEMLLTVEIPDFTQKYEQKIVLQPQETKLRIRPPMLEGVISKLNTSREAQLKVTLQDVATQKYLIQDTKHVQILSKYDMKWANDDGTETYYQNICAWVTPEAPEIKDLLRNSIDTLSYWSEGAINAMVGYQEIGGLNYYDVSYFQACAIFQTLRSYYNVRYNATPVSTSGPEAQQRIALPKDVINQKSGLCIETVVTMASAIEATGMHPMIIILPGHAQLAIEAWPGTGEYYLMETTALTEPYWDNIITYLDKDQWTYYLESSEAIVIDVELARKDGIKPME